MSQDGSDDDGNNEIPHPRETAELFGHTDAEQTLLESYRGGRIPHAWLIGGPGGIGKATLAYRMARFVLANPDQQAMDVQNAKSLAVDPENPAARRVAAQAHGGLLVLERTLGDNGKMRTRIAVDDVRKSVSFFGSTSSEGGWRVAVVDSVDELNAESANALLKVLEEPPQQTLLLLVSHAAGRVIATIRSRCRVLMLRPLDTNDVARAAAAAAARSPNDAAVKEAAAAADGSVARALGLLDGPALALRQRVIELLGQLPNPDPRALHALGDALGGNEPRTLAAFIDIVNGWLSAQIADGRQETQQLARVAQAWEKINHSAREVEIYNLERKPLVFAVFGELAETAR